MIATGKERTLRTALEAAEKNKKLLVSIQPPAPPIIGERFEG